ncbi:hypothetical protein [Polaribacter cellanae]|uniref:BioF2-like acetyltransferase domain-containing protein n=1 Tax=Polaribacter cellanae TaxID=2818493 RepID=A0A975CQX8_9FLAO|nr:hypothetical protein [Polaribacter cellanae]QTE23988.1 hypothetical protein J3359_06890 [Polaribacter cellanae]
MIQYIKRKNLDVLKYDTCIENSIQSRIYAFSWYLDLVADNWDVLVLNDYQAVMPLPWKRKFGLKYITQPFFCQQLGIFSLHTIFKEMQERFLNKIPKKFLKISINMNSNNFSSAKMIEKKNYILSLDASHDTIFKSFSKGRKHAVKVGERNQLEIKEVSLELLIEIKKDNYNYMPSPIYYFSILRNLSKYMIDNNIGYVLGVFKDDILLGGVFLLKQKNRITYLFSSFTQFGKKLKGPTFIINKILEKNANTNLIFDFEGSNIKGIASFFKSFGAKKENYYQINLTKYFSQ